MPALPAQPAAPHARRSLRGLLLILVGWFVVMSAWRWITTHHQAPDTPQRIAAVLVSWGLNPPTWSGSLPVDDAEVARRIDQLASPISEQRVAAARWLASHGVRQAGSRIASAMIDPGTARPCQLAECLGSLGDDKWVNLLALNTAGSTTGDLQICCTNALGEIGSPKAVASLIDIYHRNVAATQALRALGQIADPAALPMLEQVVASPRNDFEKRAAGDAIKNIRLLQQPDPVAALLQRVRDTADAGAVDTWALRQLAGRDESRIARTLADLLNALAPRESDRIALAAALIAGGRSGADMLRNHIHHSGPGAMVAAAALTLLP